MSSTNYTLEMHCLTSLDEKQHQAGCVPAAAVHAPQLEPKQPGFPVSVFPLLSADVAAAPWTVSHLLPERQQFAAAPLQRLLQTCKDNINTS